MGFSSVIFLFRTCRFEKGSKKIVDNYYNNKFEIKDYAKFCKQLNFRDDELIKQIEIYRIAVLLIKISIHMKL